MEDNHAHCKSCGVSIPPFNLNPFVTSCEACMVSLDPKRAKKIRDKLKEDLPQSPKKKSDSFFYIIPCEGCGKDFDSPGATCPTCTQKLGDKLRGAEGNVARAQKDVHQVRARLERAEAEGAKFKAKMTNFNLRIGIYREALGKLGYTKCPVGNDSLAMALAEFVSCFPGYCIGADMGKGPSKSVSFVIHTHHCVKCGLEFTADGPDARFYTLCSGCYGKHGQPVEKKPKNQVVRVPEEVETEVVRTPGGWINMGLAGHHESIFGIASQGTGSLGHSCQGFRFKEDPDTIYPNALGWTRGAGPEAVSMYRIGRYTEETTATHAVWKKMGA